MDLKKFEEARALVDELAQIHVLYREVKSTSLYVAIPGSTTTQELKDAARSGMVAYLKERFDKVSNDLWVYHSIRVAYDEKLDYVAPDAMPEVAEAPVSYPLSDPEYSEPSQIIGEALELTHNRAQCSPTISEYLSEDELPHF